MRHMHKLKIIGKFAKLVKLLKLKLPKLKLPYQSFEMIQFFKIFAENQCFNVKKNSNI